MIFENLEQLVNARYKYFLVIVVLLFGVCFSGISQNYGSEEELKKKAEELFKAKEFVEAMPLFSQLVSLYPADLTYNYQYGACLIHGDPDKSKSLKFLRFAAAKPNVDPWVYYYLARSLHLNYEFDQAITYYEKYHATLSTKEKKEGGVEREIERCRNGKKLIRQLNEVAVLGKQEIKRSDFFRIYDLKEIGGKIIVKPDQFKSKYDVKAKEYSLIHLPDNAKVLYYASYGDNGENGKDIFRVRKMENGEWGTAENLGAPVNTPYDEDFPFMHSDGKTLYFSSKGHNSMGGYDVFKVMYNEATGTWSAPINLDFAVSSSDDDILFITNLDNDIAYFASARYSLDNYIAVYKVLITRNPPEISVIQGRFISESNAALKGAKITVMDADNNENMGVFLTNNSTGEYTIKLPKRGGTYKFILETTADAPIHTGKVNIPELDRFKSLKQELRLVGTGDGEKLVIKNLFDQEGEVSPDLIADMLRQKAKLDVNTSETDATTALAKGKSQASLVREGQDVENEGGGTAYDKMSDEQLLGEMKRDLQNMEVKVKQLQEQAAYTYTYTNKKAIRADEIYSLNDNLLDQLDGTESAEEREEVMRKVAANKKEANPMASEAIAGYSLAGSLENEAKEKKQELRGINESIALLRSKLNAGNKTEALEIFETGKKNIADVNNMGSALEIAPSRKSEELKEKQEEAKKVREYYNDLKKEQTDLENEIIRNKDEVETLKGKKKEELENQITAFELDLEDIGYEAENIRKKAQKLEEEAAFKEKELELTTVLIEKIKQNKTVEKPLAMEEKLDLEKMISYFREQNLLDDILGEEATTTLVVNTASQQNRNIDTPYAAFDEKGNSLDYDAKYEVEQQAASKMEDPRAREAALSAIKENWISTLNTDLNHKRELLSTTTDPNQQEALQLEIAALEQSIMDKEDALMASQLNTQEKERATETMSTNAPQLTVDDKTFSEGIPIPPVNAKGEPLDYHSVYSEKLAKMEGGDASSDVSVEMVNALWAQSINADVAIRKQTLKQIKDKEKKAELKQEIAALEQLAVAKQQLAAGAEAPTLADQDLGSNTTAPGTSTSSSPAYERLNAQPASIVDERGAVINYSSIYTAAIQQAIAQNDEGALRNIAAQWNTSTTAEITLRKQELETADSEEVKNQLYALIAALEMMNSERKQALATGNLAVDLAARKRAYLNLYSNPKTVTLADTTLNYDAFYRNALIVAEEQNDPERVAAIQRNWDVSRAAHLSSAKAALATAGTQEEKDQLYALIAALEAMSKAQTTGDTTSAKNEVTPGDKVPLAVVDEQGEPTDYPKQYAAMLAVADKEQDEYQKTQELAMIHTNWAKSIAVEVEGKTNELEETSKKKKKQALSEEITQLNVEKDQQEQKASTYTAQLAAMQPPPSDETEKKRAMYQHAKLGVKYDLIDYHYEGADADMKEVGMMIMEVIEMEATISEKQRLLNSTENEFERERLIADIKAMEKRSGELQLAVSAIFAKADDKEFTYQSERLASRSATNEPAKQSRVDSIQLLAQAQFNEAQTRRKVAQGASNFKEQKSLLQQAFELERMAFQTQQQALIVSGIKEELPIAMATPENTQQQGQTPVNNAAMEGNEIAEIPVAAIVTSTETEEEKTTDSSTKEESLDVVTATEPRPVEKLSVSKQEAERIETSEAYMKYEEIQTEAVRLAKEAEVTYVTANDYQQEADRVNTLAAQRRAEAKAVRKRKQRELLEQEADRLDAEAQLNQTKADSVRLVADQLDSDAKAKKSDGGIYLKSLEDEVLFQQLLAYYQAKLNGLLEVREEQRLFISEEGGEARRSISPVAEVETAVFETIDFTQLEVIEQDVFVKSKANTVSAYSAAKPIPIDKQNFPEGLVFKVQIGAFRNPIPQDLFKGFAPVNGERTASGITRYTAGIFTGFASADKAKQEIRNLGYSDAFVVAFRNGKRISVSEAMALLGEEGTTSIQEVAGTVQLPGGNTTGSQTPKPNTENSTANDLGTVNGEIIAEAQDVRQIQGLFYTVQVGVYSNTKIPDQLVNIRPLNSERTAQGYVRYTSGVYTTFEEAVQGRVSLVGKGVQDAFITAYSNGKRISVGEARKLNP
jgi:hypothetical protein